MPLSDPSPDPGLFGHGSVTWEVTRLPTAVLCVFAAAISQVGHPLVAQGAVDYSVVRADPFGRLRRTFLWVATVVYGTTVEARQACAEINAIHRRVRGVLPPGSATANVRAGEHYDATAAELHLGLYFWLIHALIVTHETFVGPLTEAKRDQLVEEWRAVPPLTGVPVELLPHRYVEVCTWLEKHTDESAGGRIVPGPGSAQILDGIRHPPGTPLWARLPWRAWMFLSAGLMPTRMRQGYGISWGRGRALLFALSAALMRRLGSPLIGRVCPVPAYVWAQSRVRGVDTVP
jgi:uncharacterized protein (DUF2236 family)